MASAPSARGYTWETPEGWTERSSSGMRLADFQLPGDPAAECYVTRLAGTGGGIEANLNRWRQQMGLEPYASGEIDALERITVLGDEAMLAEMEGSYAGMSGGEGEAGYTLLGVVAEHDGGSVFIKLTAPTDVAKAERDHFIQFCESLAEAGASPMPQASATRGTLPDGHPPVPPAAAGDTTAAPAMEGELTWITPEGWDRGSERPMRTVTFHPQGNEEAECYVISLAGAAGGMTANVNRWLSQMGADNIDDAAVAALPKITVMDQESTLIEADGVYRGMDGVDREGFSLLGVIREAEPQSLFIKFIGPSDLVEAERDNFIAFCESME